MAGRQAEAPLTYVATQGLRMYARVSETIDQRLPIPLSRFRLAIGLLHDRANLSAHTASKRTAV